MGQNKRKGGTEVIIYKDIDTTGGQSGSPVYKVDEEEDLEIIGIHVGFFKKKKANLATLITPKIRNWIIGWIEGEIPVDSEFKDHLSVPRTPMMKKNSSIEIQKLLHDICNNEEMVDSNFILRINGNLEKDKQFVHDAQNYQFPNYKMLEIEHIEGFETPEEKEALLEFLINTKPDRLKYLVIKGSTHPDIEKYMEGVANILESVSSEVYFKCLKIDDKSLSKIFEKASKVKRLVFWWWFMDVGQNFSIDWKIDYQIEELDLYMTWDAFDPQCIDSSKLRIFARALSKSWLSTTLKTIHVREISYSENEVRKTMSMFGIKADIIGDNSNPEAPY